MTIDKYEPIYPFRAESFGIVKDPANASWSVVQESEEDRFYGNGFVTGANVPSPKCINDVIWYGSQEQELSNLEDVLDMQLKQRMCFGKPIC